MKLDIILIRKEQLTLKLFLGAMLAGHGKLFLWKYKSDGELTFLKCTFADFVSLLYRKRVLSMSLLYSVLPLLFCIISLPLVFLKTSRARNKDEILGILKNNLQQGPLGDSPWLWAWLQFVMLWNFLLGDKNQSEVPSRILLIRNDQIGDAVNTVPLVRQIKIRYPNAHLTLLCNIGRFLWEDCPYVDEVLIYKTNNFFFNKSHASLRYVFRPFTFLNHLRKTKSDTVIDAIGRTENHIIMYLCGAARRICTTHYPYNLYRTEVRYVQYENTLHEAKRVLSLIKPHSEIKESDCKIEMWIKAEDEKQADKILQDLGLAENTIVGIHPGATSFLKQWPIERWADVAAILKKVYGMSVLFFEPPGSANASLEFTSRLNKLNQEATVIRGVTLHTLTALIGKCTLFLCNDSGPMHLAATTQTATVAVFGGGEYWRWKPLNPNSRIVRKPMHCSPCSQENCKDPQCVLAIQVSDVFEAAKTVLDKYTSVPAKL